MDLASTKTINNLEASRFELKGDDGVAFIDYKVGKSGSWYLVHTEVPSHWEGNGAGHKLVRETLEILDKAGKKIMPTCPFIRAYIKRHEKEYKHMLAEGFKL